MPQATSHASHADHSDHLNPWLLGGVAAIGAVTLAPYLLPLIGIGQTGAAEKIMHFVGGHDGAGNGLAAVAQGALGAIPGIGGALTSTAAVTIPGLGIGIASGALLTIGLTAVVGMGGMLLANWMQKHEDPHARIKWSNVVRVAALGTSALIALPGILGGLSVGITFLAALAGTGIGNPVAMAMKGSLGAASMQMGPASGLAALLPHVFTCGAAFVPLALAFFMGRKAPAPEPRVELVEAAPLKAGQPAELSFRVVDAQGKPLSPDQISTTFTHKLHTMVVDSSLTDYHHLHPEYDPQTGLFTCTVTPNLPGRYMAWHDFTPQGADAPVHQRMDLPANTPFGLPARIRPSSVSRAEGLQVTLAAEPALASGVDSVLHVRVTDAQGQPVNGLQPIMGAYGHLAGFSADGRHFIHSHPVTPLSEPLRDGQLAFHIRPEKAGLTQFFLQLRHEGREVTLPFGQPVQQASRFAAREEMRQHQQPAHSHAVA